MYSSVKCVFLIAVCALAQGTAEDYVRSETFARRIAEASTASEVMVSPHWLTEGTGFWYRKNIQGQDSEFIFVDAAKGQKRPAFDHTKLRTALQSEGLIKAGEKLPFGSIDTDGSVVRFRIGDKVFQFGANGSLSSYHGDLKEAKLQPLPIDLPSTSSGESTTITFINRGNTTISLNWIDSSLTPVSYGTIASGETRTINTYVGHVWRITDPNGKKIATYRAKADGSLAIIDNSTPLASSAAGLAGLAGLLGLGGAHMELNAATPGEDQALFRRQWPYQYPSIRSGKVFVRNNNVFVRDGSSEIQMTSDGTVNNSYSQQNIYISPDTNFAVVWQTQPEQKHLVTLVESSPKTQVQPKTRTIQYLKPGDQVQIDRPRIFDLQARREVPTEDSLFQNPWSIDNYGWNKDSTEYRFLFNERGHKRLRLLGMNRQGEVRTIINETSETFVDYSSKTYSKAIDGTDELIWTSERDGWNHLYLYDLKAGAVINQITKGEWVVRAVERVDMRSRQIMFKGFGMVPGQDPYYAQLARINFDGTNLQILTEGDGDHKWKWSPDRTYFTDTFSRVDMAPKSVLRDSKTGKPLVELEEGSLSALKAVGWSPAERFEAPGRDGKTPIYGIIIKPSNFDPAKKYKVIEQIYAGPQDFFCPKSFSTLTRQHELAELGFIVVQVDGMGVNWRSKKLHDVCYKNLKDAGFPDRIAWMKAAAETRPWMDISKVGIYGGSAGGQNAMGALLWHGDFYKAAAADSGCHDNRMDKIWWNEAWMGTVDKSYADSSNVVHAKQLTGALMLLVGEMDTNVDPSSTFQVANALNAAQKDYDLVFFPGGGHGAGSAGYGLRRQRDFFVKHLLGVEPPKRNGAQNVPTIGGWFLDGNSTDFSIESSDFQTPLWANRLTSSRDISTQQADMIEAFENQETEFGALRGPPSR